MQKICGQPECYTILSANGSVNDTLYNDYKMRGTGEKRAVRMLGVEKYTTTKKKKKVVKT
jgi:hypothetical protein